jgi:cellulose synthase/poly-beta-1,6-N-acetylglucosamine synthase-like glycosyltransferase
MIDLLLSPLQVILTLGSLLIVMPILVLSIESCLACLPAKRQIPAKIATRPTLAILVPAHNEAAEIATTLEILLGELTPADRLVVIADNCTDDTAAIARSYGVKAIEREDLQHRGKGYALDYGLQFLADDLPEVVVVIDADTHVERGTIDRIATLAHASGRPVQATYLLRPPERRTTKSEVSAFAFMFKNLVRPQGLARIGLPCLLQGTGMAFPRSSIRRVSWASGNIVEDIQLGLDLAVAGHPPLFCEDVKVTGVLPQLERAANSQRTRWEHGHLQTLLTQAPRLCAAALQQRRFDLVAMALDLCVPPLSLLVLMWSVAMVIAAILGAIGISWLPAAILSMGGLLLLLSIVMAWVRFGRRELSLATLLTVPGYALGKISIYLAFLTKPQTEWIRTERDRN